MVNSSTRHSTNLLVQREALFITGAWWRGRSSYIKIISRSIHGNACLEGHICRMQNPVTASPYLGRSEYTYGKVNRMKEQQTSVNKELEARKSGL